MKLHLTDPELLTDMCEPLIGRRMQVVISGTPKIRKLYFAGRIYDMNDDRAGFIFQDTEGNREVVEFENVWELSVLPE